MDAYSSNSDDGEGAHGVDGKVVVIHLGGRGKERKLCTWRGRQSVYLRQLPSGLTEYLNLANFQKYHRRRPQTILAITLAMQPSIRQELLSHGSSKSSLAHCRPSGSHCSIFLTKFRKRCLFSPSRYSSKASNDKLGIFTCPFHCPIIL